MALCNVCTTAIERWLVSRAITMYTDEYPNSTEPIHWWHQPTWDALEMAAKTCHLCSFISSEAAIHVEENRYGYVTSIAKDVRDEDSRKLRWQLFNGNRLEIFCKERMMKLKMHLALDDDSYARAPETLQKVFNVRLVSSAVDDERNVSITKQWIDTCRTRHTKCNSWTDRDSSTRHLPTRVIDVNSEGDKEVRLHITDESDKSHYIALSYCWGKPVNPFLTTAETIERHRAGIKVSSMPKTYQDAIHLTRKLGIRYIWIDALCIVQHDRADWAREAATMHRVYSRAILTLAGHSASDTSSGLIVSRPPRDRARIPIPWPFTTGPYVVSPPFKLFMVPAYPDFKPTLQSSPLSARGWTFQERALSARFLHLTPSLAHFECREAYTSEALMRMEPNVPFGFAHLNIAYPDRTKVLMHDSWAETIEAFSKRSLTVDGDRLPALAGVARVFADNGMLGGYLAGIWGDEFLRGLLWQVQRRNGGAKHRRASEYRAPSWSWASIEGPVENSTLQRAFEGTRMLEELGYDRRHVQQLLQLTASVTMDDADIFGIVEKAHISARGALLKAVCKLRREEEMKGMRSIDSPEAGDPIGAAWMDVEDETNDTVDAWICPVLTCKQTRQHPLLQAEVLILTEVAPDCNHGFSGRVFERIGKGRVAGFWVEGSKPEEFTII
ncbi:HET-domain-containing protein [Pseudovirgaria hyperparasitica]|uniref:HET-domain-containing protein n=1 Tax=Pseudovirgaria hyperparasitica TaxID=470096 RepID=A0A6A6WJM5_9PEZI|nr:HET-domain-containing protein [Pseudovirgaria hyperparasitica]KAF2762494.1 HET-domain-containing protein [Pseudovirgaria hyperparasitica]